MKKHQQADPHPQLHVDPLEDERWTWRYVEVGTGLELHSNETFASREAAMDWAQRAYPGVAFADEQD